MPAGGSNVPKRVLDVGNCDPDHTSIRLMLEEQFDAEVVRAHQSSDAIENLRSERFDLVLINRKLDRDYSDGIDIVRQIKTDTALSNVPVMLITNYPEYQQAAVAAGALHGFGKAELASPDTRKRLAEVLGSSTPAGI